MAEFFLVCAFVGGVILVCQFLLTLAGLGWVVRRFPMLAAYDARPAGIAVGEAVAIDSSPAGGASSLHL